MILKHFLDILIFNNKYSGKKSYAAYSLLIKVLFSCDPQKVVTSVQHLQIFPATNVLIIDEFPSLYYCVKNGNSLCRSANSV